LFLQEATDLWQSERASRTITTIVALNLLSTAASSMGKNQLGLDAIVRARQMCEDLQLFGVPHTEKQDVVFRAYSTSKLRATAHVAWGTYCWHSLHAFFFHEKPILYPPSLPVPGHLDEGDASASRLLWPGAPPPEYMGLTFKTLCEFFCILQDIMFVYLGPKGKQVLERVPLSFAESKYQTLLSWATTLDATMMSRSLPHNLCVRTFFHIVVVDMFRPFIADKSKNRLPMLSFASMDSSPWAIHDLSLRHLQQVILDYSLNSEPAYYSHFYNAANLIVTNTVIQNKDDSTDRFWLLLVCRFWRETMIKYPVLAQVARASLSYAMSQGCVTSTEARHLTKQIEERLPRRDDEISSSMIIDFHESTVASEGITADELARSYEELTMFGDLLNEE